MIGKLNHTDHTNLMSQESRLEIALKYQLCLNEDELEHEHVEMSEREIEQEHEHEYEHEHEHKMFLQNMWK